MSSDSGRSIAALAFGSGGRYLALGGSDRDVHIWDLALVRDALASLGLGWGRATTAAVVPPGFAPEPTPTVIVPPPKDLLSKQWPVLLRPATEQARLGRRAEADADFAAAVALQPDSSWVWAARARAFAGLGRDSRAAADLKQARQLRLEAEALLL